MMRRRAFTGAYTGLVLLTVVGLACATAQPDPSGLGTADASAGEEQPGIHRPIQPGDLEAIAERGRVLHDMERSLILGYERGLFRVGDPGTDTVLPVVSVDPGGRSGEVMFVRWMHEDIPDASNLDPAKAQRFLLVSLVLWPDRVLDLEQLTGYVAQGSREHLKVAALLAAARTAREVAPDQTFHMHALLERLPPRSARHVRGMEELQVRTYLFAAPRGGVDMQALVDVPRKKPPEVISTVVEHEANDVGDKLVHSRLSTPGPMTVARVLALGHTSGPVLVETQDGATWTVSAEDGTLSRQ
jgi:hypothetical protein